MVFVCGLCSNIESNLVCFPGPCWGSVNRGVLVCDECCSIHRGLGRHSSQVRHLTHTPWPPSQLQMVQTLYSNGSNSIWEHCLLDPSSISSGKRKANPQDRVHPHKTEFIKAKYQMLAYVHRMPCREDDSVTTKDLSKQLHSSVRTGNLETCLRLLSLGAQANFFHPEKGNTPLHVAAKAGQVSQAELLAVYGADPDALDMGGKTPIDYARQAGHQELADRLVEIQYELTDCLAFYLCGRRPDHRNGQHFIIPQMADRSLDLSEFAKAAKKKLQSLTNHQFEELAMDVYDEVDRRETDAVWLVTQNHGTLVTDTTVVPFLPVNPEYSSTRNQGRQKLARFNAHEFATLVIDILTDAKRRQRGNSCKSPREDIDDNQDNEDQPDYDSVASDEDPEREPKSAGLNTNYSESSDLSDGPITLHEFMEVKSALTASEAKVQQLLKVNCHLSEELQLLHRNNAIILNFCPLQLNSLQTEKSSLRWQTPSGQQHPRDLSGRPPLPGGRPMSMYETGSAMRQYPHRGVPPRRDDSLTVQPLPTNVSSEVTPLPPGLFYAVHCGPLPSEFLCLTVEPLLSPYSMGRNSSWLGDSSTAEQGEDETEADSTLPCTEDVICKTEQITKNIQELLRAAQENKRESFVPCSERIHVAVREMAILFPKRPCSDTVRGSLRLLTSSASRLHGECQKASPHNPCPSDMQLVTQQVIQCAYDIAKAAKQLVTVTTKENSN
uniref:Arf-GAP domain-containing protein n=1 Tax=Oncorhynchus tshawytscha TaxID=74940 RepID=A0A8C8MD82_ONCTS